MLNGIIGTGEIESIDPDFDNIKVYFVAIENRNLENARRFLEVTRKVLGNTEFLIEDCIQEAEDFDPEITKIAIWFPNGGGFDMVDFETDFAIVNEVWCEGHDFTHHKDTVSVATLEYLVENFS